MEVRQDAEVVFQQRLERCEGGSSACNGGRSMFQATGTACAKSLRLEGNTKEARKTKAARGREIRMDSCRAL